MGVNHDQFSHFSRLRPGSSALVLQMVVVLAQIVILLASVGSKSALNNVVSVGNWGVWRCCGVVEALWRM